jgi:hypothetical protein
MYLFTAPSAGVLLVRSCGCKVRPSVSSRPARKASCHIPRGQSHFCRRGAGANGIGIVTAGLPLARKTKKLITQLSHLTNEQIYAAWVNRRFFIKALIYHGALKRSTAKVESLTISNYL